MTQILLLFQQIFLLISPEPLKAHSHLQVSEGFQNRVEWKVFLTFLTIALLRMCSL